MITRLRLTFALSPGMLLLAGCAPVTSTHTVIDPPRVTEVVAWEPPSEAHPLARYAIAHGQAAADLVRCMTYTRQDNPFSQVVGVVGVKASGETLLINQQNGPSLKVTLAENSFFWSGPQGRLNPPFKELYDRLPWQPGEVPAETTQP